MLAKRMVESNEQIFRLQLFNKILTRWRQAVSVQLLGRRNNPLSFFSLLPPPTRKKICVIFHYSFVTSLPLSPSPSLSLLPLSPSLSCLYNICFLGWTFILSLNSLSSSLLSSSRNVFLSKHNCLFLCDRISAWTFLFLRHSSGKIPVLATVPVQ